MKNYLCNVLLLSLFICIAFDAFSQKHANNSFKRELRGVWVATVANIDWPSRAGLSTDVQKRELIKIFDTHQRAGINVIFLQVRPAADAFYAKGREPWSRFLTGIEGQAPMPAYDPLAFAIEEAHNRGMELHAWINPYRATFDLNPAHISEDHISRRHPEWFFTYGGKKLFNPGIPAVRDYISEVVMDIVKHYDIDGIHLDDYFYPYPDKNPIPDVLTFRMYGKAFSNIEDWRRNNVDILIKKLGERIHDEKRYVKFGISPFGIWENQSHHPEGSLTSGFSGYRQLYADAKKWAEQGWIDYLVPQLYFPFYYRAAAFEKLVDWWSAHAFGRHMYIGLAAYRVLEKGQGWRERDQLPRQIRYLRADKSVQGSVYFSSKSLVQNMGGIRDSLQYDFYRYKSLPPTMPWLDDIAPSAPRGLTVRKGIGNTIILHWQAPDLAKDNERVYGYVVYRFAENEPIDKENAKNILYLSYNDARTTYTDDAVKPNTRYRYVVTAIDRLKNESIVSNTQTILLK